FVSPLPKSAGARPPHTFRNIARVAPRGAAAERALGSRPAAQLLVTEKGSCYATKEQRHTTARPLAEPQGAQPPAHRGRAAARRAIARGGRVSSHRHLACPAHHGRVCGGLR